MSDRIEIGDLLSNLWQLQREAGAVADGEAVSVTGLFEPEFVRTTTDFETFEEFIAESPWTIDSQEDLESIPEADLDEYVAETTTFDSWEDMIAAGSRELVEGRFAVES